MTVLDKAVLGAFAAVFVTGVSVALWGAWDMMALPRPRKRRHE